MNHEKPVAQKKEKKKEMAVNGGRSYRNLNNYQTTQQMKYGY